MMHLDAVIGAPGCVGLAVVSEEHEGLALEPSNSGEGSSERRKPIHEMAAHRGTFIRRTGCKQELLPAVA